jgi:cyclopropane fatty-acyl-phospholipid synthase-like methyltransferase
MTEKDKKMLSNIYSRALSVEQLPWHSDEAPRMLQKVVDQRKKNGKALDIGCGAGVYASYLAKKGYEVTGVDYIDKAVQYARDTVLKNGVKVEIVKADILKWDCEGPFDLILDSGCLHMMRGQERLAYRKRLLSWLANDGDYVLIHFERRHIFDWRPTGPRRVTRQGIVEFFAPDLIEQDFFREKRRAPLPVGPVVMTGSYWFRRARKS